MSKAHPPELKKNVCGLLVSAYGLVDLSLEKLYMEKTLSLKLNGGRVVTGVLRGFDPFMNLVIDETTAESKTGEKTSIGMVVVRGNSIVLLESLDRV